MNRLRPPAAVEIHSPGASSGWPVGADWVSRTSPLLLDPTSTCGPCQFGSRQSVPAWKALIDGAAAPTAASSSVAPEMAIGTVELRIVCVRKPATPGYASAIRVAASPPGPLRCIATRRPRRASRETSTESTLNESLPSRAGPIESVKSRDPADQTRLWPRLSTSAVVRNGARDQVRSATELPSTTDPLLSLAYTLSSRYAEAW